MAAVTSNEATWKNMRSKLQAMGGVASVTIGEPRDNKPQSGTVAIIPEGMRVDEVTLAHPREIHTVTIRRYENALAEPSENIELRLDQWRANIERDVMGDFDLGGNIAYALPTEFKAEYGYQTIGPPTNLTQYRLLDLTVAYRVDDRAPFVA